MLALVTTNIILNNITVSSRFSYQAYFNTKNYFFIKSLTFSKNLLFLIFEKVNQC
jgi:hypothetical protein